MCWQANELYIGEADCADIMYRTHGVGWYGVTFAELDDEERKDYLECYPDDFIPNQIAGEYFPVMIWVHDAVTLSNLLYNAWDYVGSTVVFAGNGKEPFESVLITNHEANDEYLDARLEMI